MVSYYVIMESSVLHPRSDSRNWPRSSECLCSCPSGITFLDATGCVRCIYRSAQEKKFFSRFAAEHPLREIMFFTEKNKSHAKLREILRWVANDLRYLHAEREDWSDGEIERMPSLIWAFTQRVIEPTQNCYVPNIIIGWEEECNCNFIL